MVFPGCVQVVRLACRDASTSDLERIAAAVDRIEATVNASEEGGRADHKFHAALVRASRSETLTQLYAAMSTLLARSHHARRDVGGGGPAQVILTTGADGVVACDAGGCRLLDEGRRASLRPYRRDLRPLQQADISSVGVPVPARKDAREE